MKDLRKEKSNLSKASAITLFVFVGVLAILMTVFCVLYATSKTQLKESSTNLEKIYQRSFYDLVDNINNAEIKLGKLVNSTNDEYARKMLAEIHENANNAQSNLSYLPISMNGISETIKFINQLGGFSTTLTQAGTRKLSSEERETLRSLHQCVADVKYQLNEMANEVAKGYNISAHSKLANGQDYTNFTQRIQQIKTNTQYPSMIYDGPFSNSVVNKEIKGLNFEEISKEEAKQKASQIFSAHEEAVEQNDGQQSSLQNITYVGETNGRFQTFDFAISLEDGAQFYAQITKKGGKLLTLSAQTNKVGENVSQQQAIEIAQDFASNQGIENMQCVWTQTIGGNCYVNLAPVENNVILYPDLIKVKVDLENGNVAGWEATNFYTNHINRNLPTPSVSASEVESEIDESFEIVSNKLALSPLDYNREVLTREVKCSKEGATYYFYFNAQEGNLENVLKVVSTNNGDLLM